MRLVAAISMLYVLAVSVCTQAITSTSTLPEGINSPSFRLAQIDGIDQKYTESGSLMKLGDYRSVVFDANTLARYNADAQKLINALNRFGAHKLGDDFNLGVLKIDTKPVVKYFAPVFARGITNKWTLGVGLPVVSYKNQIALSQQFSNIEYYRAQFKGLSPELDNALDTDLGQATRQTLKSKGYKDLDNRDESFLGDIQIASLYKFFENANQALVYQAQLTLPTGPKYDADDLAALNIFGRTNINSTLAFSQRLGTRFVAVPYVSYILNISDQVLARVPADEEDALPDASTKEDVRRQIGNTATLGGSLFYQVNDSWTLGAGYDISSKESDQFSGGKGTRYDLLATNTSTQYQRSKAEASYSSVKSYFKKTAVLPMVVSLEVSDVIAGVNVERQLVQELNVMMFF